MPIDLRSDTVTRPSAAMRAAMARAEVGDDVYGEDPTVLALEERTAALLGKPAALFVPTGTMANQAALLVHCRPGEEVIVPRGAHLFFHEGGAGAAFAGAQFVECGGASGWMTLEELDAAIKPPLYHLPRTRLLSLENTHNRAGGAVVPQATVAALVAHARSRGLRAHLDGARIWNAHVATGTSLAELAAPFDTISVCYSKGLGAPVGSALVADRETVEHARRYRRMLGGAMRQAGVIAAGALYALEHNIARLKDDHANARTLAAALARVPGLTCDPERTATNIVNVDTQRPASDWADALRREQVLISPSGSHRLRAVTHLDVATADLTAVVAAFTAVAGRS